MPFRVAIFAILAVVCGVEPAVAAPNADIVFVTQVPLPADFANVVSTFGNHRATIGSAPRGGDLYLRRRDGSLVNLTRAAGYGQDGLQGANAIAVRDPAVHWSGTKVIFSMVRGAPERYEHNPYYWQLYEITGLGIGETPVISKVPNQPATYNNIMPVYGTDERIIFVSDRPRNGERHLYPQRDEYESTPTNTGLWNLNPASGELLLLDHAPSGDFTPIIDSFGRVLFTRWDHLVRDQQGDNTNEFGAFNYSDESLASQPLNSKLEIFPEPRVLAQQTDPTLNPHDFNHFFIWQINEDGTDIETINHIGRHELHEYFEPSFNNDRNLEEFFDEESERTNPNTIANLFQVREDPLAAGRYFAIDAPEFDTHASGQIVSFEAPPTLPADQTRISYITHRATANPSNSPNSNHSGMYRNPLPLSDGSLIASHTTETRGDRNEGSREFPVSRYALRLKSLARSGNHYLPVENLTTGIVKTVRYYDPDELVTFSGPLWELQAVELRARAKPTRRNSVLQAPEQQIFTETGVNVDQFKDYLRRNDLALIVSRDVTTRDIADRQQPFNLRVAGTSKETRAEPGKLYDVHSLQMFQGDLIRGYQDFGRGGRRVLARLIHDRFSENLPNPEGPAGSVRVASDGSLAALVPARRALTWQLTDANGNGVVRERFWLTFQAGEIRVCASCHGLNSEDQVQRSAPTNPPEALRQLLNYWNRTSRNRGAAACDFNGDGKSDYAVVRRAQNDGGSTWFVLNSGTAEIDVTNLGNSDRDVFIGGDFDGDRAADLTAVRIRGAAGLNWYSRPSTTQQTTQQGWGIPGDMPVYADIDGDLVDDRIVFRPADGSWWAIRSTLGAIGLAWGGTQDLPVPADFDGDSWEDLAVWNAETATWAILQSSRGASTDPEDTLVRQWGLPGDYPVRGDFDGDGTADLTVWRPSSGHWFTCSSADNFDCSKGSAHQWGLPGDIPLEGDFDGDGIADRTVWRPANGYWFIQRSSDGLITVQQWGLPNDEPVCASVRHVSETRY